MKYPYISTTMNNLLFYAKDKATLIGDESNFFSQGFKITVDESEFENNTREYLQNTYGEVLSPEHAEFIIELAKVNGIGCTYKNESKQCNSFTVSNGELSIYRADLGQLYTGGLKQIKIPLPPKADKQELSEWPKIGDDVQTSMGKGTVKLPPDEYGFYIILIDGEYIRFTIEQMQKPKTPEDKFASELIEKYKHLPNHEQAFAIARDVIDNALAKVKKV